MSNDQENQQLKTLLTETKSLAVVVSPTSGRDGLLAGLALSETLKEQGKSVSIVYGGELLDDLKNLPEAKDIKQLLGDNSLVVSVNTGGMPITEASYYREGVTYNFVFNPIRRNFDLSTVKMSTRAQKLDLIITIGVKTLDDLGQLYINNKSEFEKTAILNFDNHNENSHFGTLDVIDEKATSLSEMLFFKLANWGFRPSVRASYLLSLGLATSRGLSK